MIKSRLTAGLYVLLAAFAACSMVYYVAGVFALREEFVHAARYANRPFELANDGQTLETVRDVGKAAGLVPGDFLLSVNGAPFTGFAQIHDLLQHVPPGTVMRTTVRTRSGEIREVPVRLAARQGPNFTLGGYIAFLVPILGVPLLGLLVGYWVVAARPRELNAWLVLVLLAFPESAYGNLDWSFWPAPWYLMLGLWNVVIQIFSFPALLWFGILFPERWRADQRAPWFKYAVLAAVGVIFIFNVGYLAGQLFFVDAVRPLDRLDQRFDRFTSALDIISILVFLVAIFDKLRSASTADARRRLRVLAIGSGVSLGLLLVIFSVAPLFGIDAHHGTWFVAIVPLLAIFPLTLGYVLIVQRAMDVRILLRMGTKYLLARATLIAIEIVAVAFLLLRFVVPMLQRREHPLLDYLLLAACVAALFLIFISRNSFSQRLEHWLDRRFFRDAYNSEQLLSELSEQVRQLTERDVLLSVILRRISDVLHVSPVAILLRGSSVYRLQQAVGMDFGPGVLLPESSATIQNLQRTNQPATVYRDRPEPWFVEADAEEQRMLRALQAELLLPMSGRSEMLGLIALGAKKSEEPYTPTDLRLLQSVASQTGLSLEVTELVGKLADQAAQRERVNREIEIAREVQQRLFPQSMPEIAGVTLAGMCRPASEVGGDYYDLIPMEGGQLGFAIGDVSGKGISAALIMASLRASLRGLVLDEPGDLARVMQKVNRLVYEASSSSRYATFFFGTLNPQTREFRYVNAGHNPPVVVSQGFGTVRRLEACGPVVGMLPMTEYEACTLLLEPGDLLIGYTDGISEAMTADDEEWGEERMLAAVQGGPAACAEEILDGIFRSADAFTAGAEQHDDMTLLVMKLAPC